VTKRTIFDSLREETKHTQYDEEIGWINVPDLYIENMYGPGKSFRTNSKAFRNNQEISPAIPAGKVRLVCSGDSFTMGYGVDTADTWCQQLEAIDNRIESVNLGQGGYGIDQAYLWYKRNSPTLKHNIQLFAFITDDFRRMESDNFVGYGKPVLRVENGVLVNKNRPVPRLAFSIPRLPLIRQEIGNLNVVRVIRRALGSVAETPQESQTDDAQSELQLREVSLKIFEDLQKLNQEGDSAVVLVYLPSLPDYPPGNGIGRWRDFFRDLDKEHGFLTIDLVDEITQLPPEDVAALYTDSGHYSENGNRIIAQVLYNRLLALPDINSRLEKKRWHHAEVPVHGESDRQHPKKW
jgi:hypothetical protein